jgi:metal-responsive CopG/Arc/MetJ family transcriptional regulator
MVMARVQTLVQLSDRLLAVLDERAGREGVSRSEFVRRAVESYLADDIESAIDDAVLAGYAAVPSEEPDRAVFERAIESIDSEPW